MSKPDKIRILGMNGKPLKKGSKTSFKERKEGSKYKKYLLDLINDYINFCKFNEDTEARLNKLILLRNQWASFVLTWNNDLNHVTVLRITDFSKVVTHFENKERINYEENNETPDN